MTEHIQGEYAGSDFSVDTRFWKCFCDMGMHSHDWWEAHEALVDALKAADEREANLQRKNTELSGIIVEAAQASPDGLVFAVLEQALKREIEQLRDDLARVEADLEHEKHSVSEITWENGQLQNEMEKRGLELEAAQARIDELEKWKEWAKGTLASLGQIIETNEEMNEAQAQRIAELEGSLRDLLLEVRHNHTHSVAAVDRARTALEPQTPTAS